MTTTQRFWWGPDIVPCFEPELLTQADDPELAASRQQASLAMMGLSSPPANPPANPSAPEYPQMPSQPGASSAAPTSGGAVSYL